MPEPPIILRIVPSMLTLANPWYHLLYIDPRFTQVETSKASERFSFKNDEKQFVQDIFIRKPNFWVFRCDQQKSCGDFVVVNMASPQPKFREIYLIDIKQGAPLKVGGGGAGTQFKNATAAVQAISTQFAIIEETSEFTMLTGDKEEILTFWGVKKA